MTITPTHLASSLDRPYCWTKNESGDADLTRELDRVTCKGCLAIISDYRQVVKVVLTAALDSGLRIIPADDQREVEPGLTLADAGPASSNPSPTGPSGAGDAETVRVPRRIAQYAAAYIGEADHQEALDVASALEDALGVRE